MNNYTKSIWVLALGMAALIVAFLSPLFGILFGIAAIILGKKTMSEANPKWHMQASGLESPPLRLELHSGLSV